MTKDIPLMQEDFDLLLRWLDLDREIAGRKYEKIRHRLIQIFLGRSCFEAEELADETINRVTHKLPQLIDNYVGEPALYFYGVANKVHLEWLRARKRTPPQFTYIDQSEDKFTAQIEYDCLENCLKTLSSDCRELIVEYHRKEKRAKIEHRKKIAEKMNITMGALHIKTCRIRANLHKCIQNCVNTREI
jgi:DNA-directed RNA polymerase specialized sigma24 family protein